MCVAFTFGEGGCCQFGRDPVLQGFAFSFQNVHFNATLTYDYSNGAAGVNDLLSGVLSSTGAKNPYAYAGTL